MVTHSPVFLPGESQGEGSLVSCCLWGLTESDTSEATLSSSSILSPSSILGSLVRREFTVGFQFCSISQSVFFISVTTLILQSGNVLPSVSYFFLSIALALQGLFWLHTNRRIVFLFIQKKYYWSFDRDWIKSIDIFREYGHFNTITSYSWTFSIVCIFFNFFHQILFSVYRFFTSLVKFILKYVLFCVLIWISSVQYSCSVMPSSLLPREPQYTRPPCPSPTAGVYSNSWPLSQWCHPTISSSAVPFSSCPQFFPASGSFQMS